MRAQNSYNKIYPRSNSHGYTADHRYSHCLRVRGVLVLCGKASSAMKRKPTKKPLPKEEPPRSWHSGTKRRYGTYDIPTWAKDTWKDE